MLTLQAQGSETGSVFPLDGGLHGTGDVVNPLSDNQKFGVPTLGELNWTTATEVQLLFNAIEPNGDSATIDSLTLSFFSGNTLVFSISNAEPLVFDNTEPGAGSAGFLIGVSGTQLSLLEANVFDLANFGALRMGLSATISDVAAGPDSFNAVAALESPPPVAGEVPLPPSAWLFVGGLLGLGMLGYRKKHRRQA